MELRFEPTEDRILARINAEEEDGTIHAMVERVGPDVKGHEYGDRVVVLPKRYHRMTIQGIECILFKESELID